MAFKKVNSNFIHIFHRKASKVTFVGAENVCLPFRGQGDTAKREVYEISKTYDFLFCQMLEEQPFAGGSRKQGAVDDEYN